MGYTKSEIHALFVYYSLRTDDKSIRSVSCLLFFYTFYI